MSGTLRVALACGVSIWGLSGLAEAQQQSAPPADRADIAAGTTGADAGPQTDEPPTDVVVVTATLRSEDIQDVPAQVSAVSAETLEDLRANSLVDFAAFTPGVSFQTTNPTTNRVAIRGVTTGGSQLASGIGLYLDDVPLGSSTAYGAGVFSPNIGLFDLERIEVLNGPQGTLFGANALGGVLRYITQAPELNNFSGRVQGEFGKTEHGDANSAVRAMANLPLAEDQLALRLDAVTQYDSGFIDDPANGRDNRGNARTTMGRASLLFQATPDLSVRLNAFGQKVESNGLAVTFRDRFSQAPTDGPYDQSFASQQPSSTEIYVASAVVDWDLSWGSLTSITAYQDLQTKSRGDLSTAYSAILSGIFGPGAIAPYSVPANYDTERFTQELRLTSTTDDAFEWIVGAFYSDEDSFQDITVVKADDPQGYLLGIPLGRFDFPTNAKEVAVFANGTFHFSPELDATLGARYSWNDATFTTVGSGLLVVPTAPFSSVTTQSSSTEDIPTYLFNLRYRPTDSTMLYGRVANGYRPGGPNLAFGSSGTGNTSYTSDELWNYEVGIRQDLPGRRGFINVSAFHIDWSDIQLTVNRGGIGQLVNGGDATIDGVEAAFSYQLLDDLSVLGSAAYTDAKLSTASPLLGLTYEGARLPMSADYTFAAAANYSFQPADDVSGTLNLAVRYTGERTSGFAGSPAAPLYTLDPYTVVDLTLSFRSDDGWEVSPYIKNLFDDRGETSASTTNSIYIPSAPANVTFTLPRTVGIVVGRNF